LRVPLRAHYAVAIADASGTGVPESERLARRYFALFKQGEIAKMLDLIHPDVEMVLKTMRPGDVLRGRDEIVAFADEIAGRFYEAYPEVYRPLDETHIVIEGRIRWMDDDRVLRDDPMIWALEFRDGLLIRSTPAGSVLEAEAILGTAARDERA
jgi:ketosteroid isomerase-like protein